MLMAPSVWFQYCQSASSSRRAGPEPRKRWTRLRASSTSRPRPARVVADPEYRELHGCVGRHVDPELRCDPVLSVLEDAVAETVPADVGRRPARGKRSGRPEPAGLLVAKVERLAAGIGDGVV